ncbi:peptide chain release factor 1 [Prevotella koreensis]|uniref:peptide chain release factor 1 n=1 Tax=Prevotella koreensis TaxID=2490854 RepID=UPI003F9F822A
MKEGIKKELYTLIQEQKDRIQRLQSDGSLYLPYYYSNEDNDKYIKWLTKTYRFLRTYFKNDDDVETFESVSKEYKTPRQQKKLLYILESFLDYPNIIETKVEGMTELAKGGSRIIINNTNSQSQQQSQQQGMEILIKSLEDQLSVSQLKELMQIVDVEKGDLEKAKPKLIDKIKSFGENVASNILANIITNPTIWSCLG